MKPKGVIAAGHPQTVKAAATILEQGGNAFDAALAGMCAANVTEPVLTSLGGGGFLLARTGNGETRLYDFFVQTPGTGNPDIDFFPIIADFGNAKQEFHIGRGSIATPGMVKGMFKVHDDLASMPMASIIEPAVRLAKEGVRVNRLQQYIFGIVENIYNSNDACRAIFASRKDAGQLIGEGEILFNPDYADALENLAREGEDLFYKGDMAKRIAEDCRTGGGNLAMEDFLDYRVVVRKPLEMSYKGSRLWTNPPPSSGGILIAFALELLKGAGLAELGFGSAAYLECLARAMELTNKARIDSCLHQTDETAAAGKLLDPEYLQAYRRQVLGRAAAPRGTTHISVIDASGNAACLSLSNGEGSAYIVPGTGIMLNNMLGEEDINPHGLKKWPLNQRMCSMMSPTIMAEADDSIMTAGSGGSNRIRTAVLQVLLNRLEFSMSLKAAVTSPRIHYENGLLNIENGFDEDEISTLVEKIPKTRIWEEKNLFFGGVHSVRFNPRGSCFDGAGDPRRGGVAVTV